MSWAPVQNVAQSMDVYVVQSVWEMSPIGVYTTMDSAQWEAKEWLKLFDEHCEIYKVTLGKSTCDLDPEWSTQQAKA